jgi:hypothetical protein
MEKRNKKTSLGIWTYDSDKYIIWASRTSKLVNTPGNNYIVVVTLFFYSGQRRGATPDTFLEVAQVTSTTFSSFIYH